jgi:Icc protein
MISRRELFGVGSALVSSTLIAKSEISLESKRVVRLAHFTDIHVQPEKNAPEGMKSALLHCQSLKDKPDLLVTGGDLIMDSFAANRERTKKQWDLFTKILGDYCELPVEHCIGNHDVWGWAKTVSGVQNNEDGYGKKWVMDVLGLDKPYRWFDRENWRFFVLDSTFQKGESYEGRIDEAQWHWFLSELQATPSDLYVCVITHIPILAACAYLDGNNEKTGDWVVPGAWMHLDARRFKDLFRKHKNVRVCLSGHIHLVDKVEYLGVTYICGGAVCGGWWNGNYQETSPGYGIVDLYDDGNFKYEYVAWMP